MSGVRMELTLTNLNEFADMADDVVRAGNNTQDLMEVIGAYGVSSTQMRFRQGVSPDGDPWQKSARVNATGGQTLVDTGRLRNSIFSETTSHSAAWGTNLIYAAAHQFGAVIKAINSKYLKFKIPGLGFFFAEQVIIPARPFVGIAHADEMAFKEMVIDHYSGGRK